MSYEFKFPDIGEGLIEGEIVEWKVKVGDRVSGHQTLLEVETDKAVAEVPSPVAGVVLELKGGPGDVINVGEVIAVIGEESELAKDAAPKPAARPAETSVAVPPMPTTKVSVTPAPPHRPFKESVGVVGELEEAPDEEEEETPVETPHPSPKIASSIYPSPLAGEGGPEGRVRGNGVPARRGDNMETETTQQPISRPRVDALPKDRALAKQLGVVIDKLRGTGPRGRVTEDDVRKAAGRGTPEKGAPEPAGRPGGDTFGPVEHIPLRGVRRKIAQAMVNSLTKAAQVTTTDEADVSLLWHIREKEKEAAKADGVHLTFLPFIVKAVVGALKRDPLMNSVMDDDKGEIAVRGYYNIGIAVETRDGLIVPNVKYADRKQVIELARELEALAESARKRTLELEDLRGGTFTITNYGSIGGIFGTPVLNYPEAGILGVGKITEKPVVINGEIKVRRILPLSLTFDHRIVDGATAQHFLNGVIARLEDPDRIFVGV
ncbi:MAG: 2-oxo acid dehydrogenase subunit E2 [Nitrospirae bacterium]|nr:2-oxo acid dehydrogenase subunit E2 [Nitrospirota bacterium]